MLCFVCLSVICKCLYAFCHNMFCLLLYVSVKNLCYMFVKTPTLNKTFMLYALCFIDMAGQADINKQLKKRLFE